MTMLQKLTYLQGGLDVFKKIWDNIKKVCRKGVVDMAKISENSLHEAEIKKFSNAEEVLKEFWDGELPVNLEAIAKACDITVETTNFDEISEELGHRVYGMIFTGDNNKRHIMVNENDIPTRRRFTIAHELGHYFLHDGDKTFVNFRGLSTPKERQADKFAAELLMPEKRLREEHGKLFFPLVSQLAERFNVSKEAMRYRLDEMGLSSIEL